MLVVHRLPPIMQYTSSCRLLRVLLRAMGYQSVHIEEIELKQSGVPARPFTHLSLANANSNNKVIMVINW